jgi:hypothetical protein
MGLWIKNDDGSIEKVAGSGGGGGSFDGEHVLTGDVDNPPEELAVGQLMWDGVEGSSGGSGGGSFDGEHVPTGDPTDPAMFEALDVGQLLYDGVEDTGADPDYAVVRSNASGLTTTYDGTTPIGWDVTEVVSGGITVTYDGSGRAIEFVVPSDGMYNIGFQVYTWEGTAWPDAATAKLQLSIVNDTASVVLSDDRFYWGGNLIRNGSSAQQFLSAGDRISTRCSIVGSTSPYFQNPSDSWFSIAKVDGTQGPQGPPGSGGSGDAGPHDHDYLPLAGGTVTGDLTVDGKLNVGGDFSVTGIDVAAGYVRHADGDYSWPSISFQNDMQAGFYLAGPQKVGLRSDLTVDGTVATINPGSEGAPAFTSTLYPTTGMYTHAEGVFFAVDGQWKFGAWADRVGIRHDLQVDGKITNAEVNGNTAELALRGIIGAKRGSATDTKHNGLAIAAYRALTLRAGRRFRISGTVNIGKHTAADGYTDGYVTVGLRIDGLTLTQHSIFMKAEEMTSVHLEWTGPALTGASGGSWQGVSIEADAPTWQYVGSYDRRATLIIEDVGPYVDLNDYGRTATELEHPETRDLDQQNGEPIELPDPTARIEELEGA